MPKPSVYRRFCDTTNSLMGPDPRILVGNSSYRTMWRQLTSFLIVVGVILLWAILVIGPIVVVTHFIIKYW